MVSTWAVIGLLATVSGTPTDSVRKDVGVQIHTGFIIPHASDLKAISQSSPVGVMVEYSRINLQRSAFDRCNCFARIGTYAHYIAFNNPDELGRTVGAGAFFEPLIRYGKPLSFSIRTTAGLAYLTRVFDPQTNPRNTFFGAALNGWLGLSAAAHFRVSKHLRVSLSANYNHISNGGSRQPNRGMNFPTLAAGMIYTARPLLFPDPRSWSKPLLTKRSVVRLLSFASIRTLPQTDLFPEKAAWLIGITATAGWRLNRFHTLSGGTELVYDGYIREQRRRVNRSPDGWQAAVLGGYELWLGRYVFAAHLGWNAHQPDTILEGRVFQRYQLLYALNDRIQLGVGLKSKLQVAEGFDVRAGLAF